MRRPVKAAVFALAVALVTGVGVAQYEEWRSRQDILGAVNESSAIARQERAAALKLYVSRQELTARFTRLEAKLDKIIDRLGRR